MRAPQYGQTRWQVNRRTNNAALPYENATLGRLKPCGYAKLSNGHGTNKPGKSLVQPRRSGRGHVAPIALYGPPLRRIRFKHKRHTKLTLTLWNVAPNIWGKPRDPWASKYQGSRKTRSLVKALKQAYILRHGSLAGPIVTKKQPRLAGKAAYPA